ncbi:MAG: hypothetical protein KME26_26030 [Oscillatoria princeps RMCB-10]|nr:hypothetical protein [Oscillatoria princeps RMCB-10]
MGGTTTGLRNILPDFQGLSRCYRPESVGKLCLQIAVAINPCGLVELVFFN